MSKITVALAKRAMLLRELTPADPEDSIGGLSEIFRHPAFTEGSEEVRERFLRLSAQTRYDDEISFPWDNYFGRSVKPWVRGDMLDLGSFTGGRAVAWHERYETRSLAGVDVDEVFVEAGRRFAAAKATSADFRVGFGEAIPWPDESFDSILTFDVLEHVRDVKKTISECWRVLRPGGHLLLVFPSYFQPVEHHLSLVTSTPGVQLIFSGPTQIRAYHEILTERGAAADWYSRGPDPEAWERGNTINGTTARRFSRLIESDWDVVLHSRLPIGAVGRRAASGKGAFIAALCRPLTRVPGLQEVATHRVTYILRKGERH